MTDPVVDLPAYTPVPEQAPGPTRPRPAVVAALVVGLVGLVASAVFAIALFGGEGGSSSPEDAVTDLLDAVEQEDVIGVLEALAPGERDALREPIEDVATELKRLGIFDTSLDLGKIAGLDVEFDGVELASEPLADHLAAVRIVGGTARATTTPGDLPIGPTLRGFMDELGARDIEPTESTEDLAESDVTIATVRDDGRWYVSLFYSIAENARRDAGEPLPPFGSGVPAEGEGSPEAAVEALVRAAVQLDIRKLVALTPPDEMAALHDYAPLFLDDARQSIDDVGVEFGLTVDALELDTDSNGDTARVTFEAFAVSGTFAGEPVAFEWDGECVRVRAPDFGAEEQCQGDQASPGDAGLLFPFPAGLSDLQFSLTAVRVDGAWYVSPTRSVLGLLVDVLRGVEREDIENVAEFFMSGFFPFGVSSSEGYDVGEDIHVEEGPSGAWMEPVEPIDPEYPVAPEAQFKCFESFQRSEPRTEEEYRAAEQELERCLSTAQGSGD